MTSKVRKPSTIFCALLLSGYIFSTPLAIAQQTEPLRGPVSNTQAVSSPIVPTDAQPIISPTDPQLRGLSSPDPSPPSPQFNPRALTNDASALQGVAEYISTIPASAIETNSKLMPSCMPLDLKCIEIHLKNNTDKVMYINGATTTALSGGNTVPASNFQEVVASSDCGMSATRTASVAAVTLVSLGFFGPLFHEIVTPHEDLQWPFGRDEVRHEVQEKRFGERVLMPGDDTTGWLCFRIPKDAKVDSVCVPVVIGHESASAGKVTIPIEALAVPSTPNTNVP